MESDQGNVVAQSSCSLSAYRGSI